MDFTDSTSAPSPSTAPLDVPRELRVLRLAVSLMLVALIILSGSLGVYLFRQVTLLRRQADHATALAAQSLQNYREQVEPRALAFERQLTEFARTNTDFQIRFAKFLSGSSSTSNTPASTPPTEARDGK